MRSFRNHLLATLIAIAIVGCATKPSQYENISSTANPTAEIEKTEGMMKEAYDRQVDVLSPENFTDAKKSLEKAKKMREKGTANEDVLAQVAYSRGWLKEANEKAELAQTSMKEIADARAGALHAGSSALLPKEWKKAEKELAEITSAIEKGNLTPAEKKGQAVTSRYRELEIMAVTKDNLSSADDNIKNAKRNGAEKKAPKSYSLTMMKYENAEKLINANPRNSEAIRRASEDAVRESAHLAEVTRRVNAGNTEDLVLLSERQQRQISTLRTEHTSAEEELQLSQEQLDRAERDRQELAGKQARLEKAKRASDTADELRKQFKPNEAEVFTEGGRVMVRLKALQFPSSQATLGPKNRAFLSKVETALNSVDKSRITVEGHTDSSGSPQTNKMLAEKRAQTVQNFLVSTGSVSQDQVKAIGIGPDDPISDNSTPQGRAQNRRIDLVIDTE